MFTGPGSESRTMRFGGLLLAVLPFFMLLLPDPTESYIGDWYRSWIFPVVRFAYDYTLGWMPLPSFFWLLGIWLLFLFYPLWVRGRQFSIKISGLALRLVYVAGAFYWLWGINYLARTPQEALGLTRQRIPLEQLENAFCRELDLMRISRPDSFAFEKVGMENEVRHSVRTVLEDAGLPAYGRPRIRVLEPKGVLLRLATAGVYMPYVFEGQIDGGMHPAIQGFTMAHEMAHAFGIGHEGSSNLVAYLAGLSSDNELLRYSSHISYWRYLAGEIRKLSREDYHRLWLELDPDIIADIHAIDDYFDRYPDLFPLAQSTIYDHYLKVQGMEEGLGTYRQIIAWVENWYEQKAGQSKE